MSDIVVSDFDVFTEKFSEWRVYFDFLDSLRLSGVISMFGAGVYLREIFDLSRSDAREVLLMWMCVCNQGDLEDFYV